MMDDWRVIYGGYVLSIVAIGVATFIIIT